MGLWAVVMETLFSGGAWQCIELIQIIKVLLYESHEKCLKNQTEMIPLQTFLAQQKSKKAHFVFAKC